MKAAIPLVAVMACTACSGFETSAPTEPVVAPEGSFAADVWADNWFALSVNGGQVAIDSVPITTERSFNAESFTFPAERPFVLALEAKDFKENDSGLEYIGTDRQQMGDGGVIVQVRNSRGETVAVTNDGWKCLVIHHAPVEKSCAQEANPIPGEGACAYEASDAPEGWTTLDFDDSAWPAATIHSGADVSPKDGYDEITWDSTAQLIWGPDLQTDNTILCRFVVE